MFDTSVVQKFLKTQHVGRKLIYKALTGTTMDDAEQGAKLGNGHGVAYVADTQTNARGSKGRSWDAKSSGNIYVSFIVHRAAQKGVPVPERSLENDIELAASLASLDVLQKRGVQGIKVKWLNDLWVQGHKLLGALAEFKGLIKVEDTDMYLYILGIGLNLNSDMRHQSELRGLATSTLCETGQELPREEVFADVCNQLEINLQKSREELMNMYNEHAVLRNGDKLKVYYTDGSQPIKVSTYRGVENNWSISFEDSNGDTFSLPVFEVSVRPHPCKAIYILNGPHIENWSYSLLMKTCYSLVDTVLYDVKTITLEALKKGKPSDMVLLVIGQQTTGMADTSLVDLVHEYVKGGGTCLCTGSGCGLFSGTPENQNYSASVGNHPTVSMVICNSTSSSQHATVNLFSCHDQSDLGAKDVSNIQMLARLECRGASNNDLCETNDDKSVSMETLSINNHVQEGFHKRPGVLGCEFGTGKLCLCSANIEVSYADVQQYFPDQLGVKESLQRTVFTRDFLFQAMIKWCVV